MGCNTKAEYCIICGKKLTLLKVNNPEYGECSNCRTKYRIGKRIMEPCKKFVMLKGELTEIDSKKEVDYKQYDQPFPTIPRHLIPELRKLFKNSSNSEEYIKRADKLMLLDKQYKGPKSRKNIQMMVMQIA